MGRPSSAARALAPRIKYWDARGPAPHDTNCLMNAGTSASPPPGRVIRTSVTAERTNGFGTGMRRTRCCNANTSSAVNTGDRATEIAPVLTRSEEHTSELQSRLHLVCRLLLEKKKNKSTRTKPAPELL